MENKRASQLISDNLKNIYGYAFARLYDKDDVDDLTQQIVYEVLRSADRIRDEEAFWGFLWKVADNTFCKFIKQKERRNSLLPLPDEDAASDSAPLPEEELIGRESKNEELSRLRRELSLLSKTNREVCLAYYFQNKSCKQIAAEQNLSLEMVKYHLFKTRQLLKEGIGMERTFGEKSYNPGVFRINFWGDRNYYYDLFKKKLPGSVLLAAYYTALTDRELSLELGVAMPYLEDELKELVDAGVLIKRGDKYGTNLVILTEEFEKDLQNKTKNLFDECSTDLFGIAKSILPDIRSLSFKGDDIDDNRLIVALMNIAFVNAFGRLNETHPYGEYKPLKLGGSGFIWGHDNDYKYGHFTGISMYIKADDSDCWISAENYKVFDPCCHWSHSHWRSNSILTLSAVAGDRLSDVPKDAQHDALVDALAEGYIKIENGALSAAFPVFEAQTYARVTELLEPVIEKAGEVMLAYAEKAAELLAQHCPASVRDQCNAITAINYRLDAAAIIFETLVKNGQITVPNEKVPMTIWGVK